MALSSARRESLLEQQHLADQVEASLDRRAWLKRFVLAIVLIVLTVAVATVVAKYL